MADQNALALPFALENATRISRYNKHFLESLMVIRPSTRLVKATYVFAALLAMAVVILANVSKGGKSWYFGLIIPGVLGLGAAIRHVRRSFTRIEIRGDRLQYQSGMTSTTSRSIPLAKVQDITVNQTIAQRILGLGNLSIETAGETSRLTIEEIDAPRVVAEKILDLVNRYHPDRT